MIEVRYLNKDFVVIGKDVYELVSNYLLDFINDNQNFYGEIYGEIKEFKLYRGNCLGHGVRGMTWETRIASIDGKIDMSKYDFSREVTKLCRYVNKIELNCKYPEFLNCI